MTAAPPMITVEIQFHAPDQVFYAGFLRDGEPWILKGALLGTGSTPGQAVAELIGAARHLVINGENYMTGGPLPLADREWLFAMLDIPAGGIDPTLEMYPAIHAARQAAQPEGSTAL